MVPSPLKIDSACQILLAASAQIVIAGHHHINNIALSDSLMALKSTKSNDCFSYVPTGFSKQEFDSFCCLARSGNRQKEAIIVIEELAAITNAGKASGYWGVLVNQSL